MEHLMDPKLVDAHQDHIFHAPWLGFAHDQPRRYPAVPVNEYLSIRGISEKVLNDTKGEHRIQSTATLALLQSLLFFGLLESAFDHEFSTTSYVRKSSDGAVVNTAPLRDFLQSRQTHLRDHYGDEDYLRPHIARLAQTLEYANEWNEILLDIELSPSVVEEEFHLVHRMLLICAETISETKMVFPSRLVTSYQFPPLYQTKYNTAVMRKELRSRGWCPSTYDRLSELKSCTLAYTLALGPPEGVAEAHISCNETLCLENNIDEKTYRPKHAKRGCSCENFPIPRSAVLDILAERNIPLLDSKEISSPEDAIKPYKEGLQYVAFSHVWSDGLGSCTERSLPRCSVQRLCRLVQRCKSANICNMDLFWIDSLCIPESKELRTAAIANMANIYSKASTTIVLDESLASVDAAGTNYETLLVRLATASWSRRMWTLQEGILSQNLHFLIADQLIPALDIMENAMFRSLLTPITVQCGLELFDIVKSRRQPGYDIGRLVNQLRYRTTSKPGDELGCVAAIMGLDVGQLLKLKGEERLVQFWKLVGTVPGDIVVTPGQRLTCPGFRWAPTSLLSQRRSANKTSDCTVTDYGLRGSFWIIQFHERIKLFEEEQGYVIHVSDASFAVTRAGGPRRHPNGFDCDAIVVEKQPKGIGSWYFSLGLARSPQSSGIFNAFAPVYDSQDPLILKLVSKSEEMGLEKMTKTEGNVSEALRVIQAAPVIQKRLIIN